MTAGVHLLVLDGHGPGVRLAFPAPYARARPEAGATLVLYSDGPVERRGESLDVGLERLADGAGWREGFDPETLCGA